MKRKRKSEWNERRRNNGSESHHSTLLWHHCLINTKMMESVTWSPPPPITNKRGSRIKAASPEADDCHDTHAPELVRLEPFVRARWKQLSRAFGRCHLGSTNLNIIFLTFHFLPAALISRRADGGRRNVSQVLTELEERESGAREKGCMIRRTLSL